MNKSTGMLVWMEESKGALTTLTNKCMSRLKKLLSDIQVSFMR
jgi:hypothetical protein